MNRKSALGAILCLLVAWLAACEGVGSNPDCGRASNAAEPSAVANAKAPTALAQTASADPTAVGKSASASTSSSSPPSRCNEVCKLSDSLPCSGQANCLTTCEEMRADAGKCKGHVDAFLACLTQRTASDFECGDEDAPSVKDGICEAEQATLAHCVMDSL